MTKEQQQILEKSSVLLIEDEERLRKSFKKVLSLYVGEVYEASDGEEGLKAYEKRCPNIIITDIRMPKMNGLDFIEIIRKTNKTIPIVVTSAYSDMDYLLKSIKLLLIEYLLKPIQEKDLIRVFSSCAAKLLEDGGTYTEFENGRYDCQNRVFIDEKGGIHELTAKEIELLELLLKNRGRLLSKEYIEESLYICDAAPVSALKNIIFKLRKKIGYKTILSVGRSGYKIKQADL
ncbi:MAG: response regulator [Campylobacteraceae bacterium]|jgi:YesN/AraC family two-component response regulator|nr:response regulator [Campylobacteraceae bacterium]